jgi:hypothetical protein
MTKKKIIILIGIILGVLLIIWGFTILLKPSTTTTQTGNTTTTGTNFFTNLFPFINTISNTADKVLNVLGIGDQTPTEEQVSLLQKVSSFPIAGYSVFNRERFIEVPEMSPAVTTATQTTTNTNTATTKEAAPAIITPPTETVQVLKYTEKATGNVYQTYVDKIDERKISSNTIPTVHESFFAGNGESVIMRYLQGTSTIETFMKNLPKEILGGDAIENLQNPGTFLPENITDLSISPDSSQIFYLFNTQNYSIGVTASANGDGKTQVFASPFTEWLSQWPNDRMITLTTKPSSNVPGYMYAVDPIKKDFNKILGGINGLTTLTSPNGKLVLYNTNNLSLYVYNTETGDSQPLSIKTLPEKCTWLKSSVEIYCAVPKNIPSGQYPDSWYMGEISFSDNIWYVDMNSNNTSIVLDTEGKEDLDMTKVTIDDSQNNLFFINKKDSYLWKLEL